MKKIILTVASFCVFSFLLAQNQNYKTFQGKATILGYKNDIAIFINDYDSINNTFNSFADRVFILQSENDYSNVSIAIDEKCKITIYNELLCLTYSPNIIIFGITESLNDFTSQSPSNNTKIFNGYGISHTNIKDFHINRGTLTNLLDESAYTYIQRFSPSKNVGGN